MDRELRSVRLRNKAGRCGKVANGIRPGEKGNIDSTLAVSPEVEKDRGGEDGGYIM